MSILNKLTLAGSAAALAITATAATAQTTNLRIQTHFSQETLSGQMAGEFIDDVTAMSNGEIQIEMFYSSSVVASAETFDAAATGILDCDMTGGSYQTGKNPAFQFTGDLTGGYANPYQQYAWLLHGGGYDALNALYNSYDMEFVGWWIPGPESLSSTRPIAGVADLEGWKFRSPPGVITLIFEKLGASPVVMDFNEIFTALETGIIDGADAANLTNNIGLGLYDIAEHTNYPGFHSMPADHLACNKSVWDAMPAHHQAILKVAMQALALKNTTINEVRNAENSVTLAAEGLNMYQWSEEDMAVYRQAVQEAWVEFATTPESQNLLNAHLDFLRSIGAME
ncbi:TRAP-type mannitol/chloroaromatic compound transport system, substrate-binding protein [Yoonia tamlensis]|uniref:TRAP-type mannitol/chloroaromatic compound transport system, substrate-binding protein n=1 Tax=Yoonia tamlensis TaxID=390270 RepID=A0A1I6HEG6_9RHOB|nr:TRAP transporter substrate-binding protein [Yoonia tamlensis]SFR52764.1 TRAP-type mannitol/chloroaromatic compound transport system, substrate-binding protein [Yoonia tamlensis]